MLYMTKDKKKKGKQKIAWARYSAKRKKYIYTTQKKSFYKRTECETKCEIYV